MDRQELYNIYQCNIDLLEEEMELVRKSVVSTIGKKIYEENELEKKIQNHQPSQVTDAISGKINSLDKQILAGTRLYTFLICSWFEARLRKILYESSSVAFSDSERKIVQKIVLKSPSGKKREQNRDMEKQWKSCLNLAVCKGLSISFPDSLDIDSNCSILFVNHPEISHVYSEIYDYTEMIKGAITIRNRLAHGQWRFQLNANRTNYAEETVHSFFSNYDNIQKLENLYAIFREIAEIISAFVVYKDREGEKKERFYKDISNRMKKIHTFKRNIEKKSYAKYCMNLYYYEVKRRERMKNN